VQTFWILKTPGLGFPSLKRKEGFGVIVDRASTETGGNKSRSWYRRISRQTLATLNGISESLHGPMYPRRMARDHEQDNDRDRLRSSLPISLSQGLKIPTPRTHSNVSRRISATFCQDLSPATQSPPLRKSASQILFLSSFHPPWIFQLTR